MDGKNMAEIKIVITWSTIKSSHVYSFDETK